MSDGTGPRDAGARSALERTFRREASRLTASLVALTGDWDLAEEFVQDAVVAALRHWPGDGVPDNPAAWLQTTARRRAIDAVRRDARFRERMPELARRIEEATVTPGGATDDRLRLIFTCCHPALRRESQVALTLRTVCGLSTAEVARAFLAPEPTVAQRIVRAKSKIRAAGIPFRIPRDHELPDRLREVLDVLYLVFNEGYLATSGAEPVRLDLAREAEWLTGLVVELMPDEPEPMGLLAMMRIHLARAPARFGPQGDMVLLADQDRTAWDHDAIEDADELIRRAARLRRPGPHQLQAAIAAVHARAASFEQTDWTQILVLYDALLELSTSPVVAMNRAIAVACRDGAEAGLADLEGLVASLDRYGPYHAARSELWRRCGRLPEARAAAERALELIANPAERSLLEARIASMDADA